MRLCSVIPLVTALAVFAPGTLLAATELQLELATDRAFYAPDTKSKFFVEARITPNIPVQDASATNPPTAATRNVVLVLDRSGSMAGAPIQNLRTAAANALASLSDRDTLAIIAFGSEVETVIAATRVDQARGLVDRITRIEPAGGAALYDALNQGAAQLRRFAATADTSDLILVIDGPATRGPREADDFLRLARTFAREGVRLSAIGLGSDFDEDLLANIARAGNGRFSYAAGPADLDGSLQSMLTLPDQVIARNLMVELAFADYCNELTAHGWTAADATNSTVTFSVPYLQTGQTLSLISSARIWNTWAASGQQPAVVTATLTWQDAGAAPNDAVQTTTQTVAMNFERVGTFNPAYRNDTGDGLPTYDDSTRITILRRVIDTLISDSMQEAIEHIDTGHFGRAIRELRRTRSDVRFYAKKYEDEGIEERLGHLDAYLNEIEARGINQLDRKILRSGLSNRFEPPLAAPADEERR